MLTCSPRPAEAIELLEYLVGNSPDVMRGHAAAFGWLGYLMLLAPQISSSGRQRASSYEQWIGILKSCCPIIV